MQSHPRQVGSSDIVESSDKMGSIGGRKGKSLQYFRLKNTMNGMKKQKDLTLEDEF